MRGVSQYIPQPVLSRSIRWIAVLSALLLVWIYYRWEVRAIAQEYDFGYDLGGYYNELGRAFASGQLHLPVQPSPKLLALPNPWDPLAHPEYKMHDLALFNGRYYLYHGAGPAVILFTPWRLLTGYDLPENFGLILLCY